MSISDNRKLFGKDLNGTNDQRAKAITALEDMKAPEIETREITDSPRLDDLHNVADTTPNLFR